MTDQKSDQPPASFSVETAAMDGFDLSLLKQITQNLQEGVLVLDVEGRLLFMNAEGERLVGWSMEELLGQKIHNILHYQNPHLPQVTAEECPVHKSIVSGQTYTVSEEAFSHRDGHIVPVSYTATPIFQAGKVVYGVTTFQDLIRRKQAEREIKQARDIALETSRLRSEFLANMSHEIRTPINGVIGMSSLLINTKLNKEQKEMVITARESAQALLTMVNDILDFSRLEGGKLDIQGIDFVPEKLVSDVSYLLGSQAQNKGLSLTHQISDKIPPLLRGDPARLRQALLNLTGNAVKFTKKGTITLSASLEEKSKSRVILRFTVADTGIGIPKSARHRIFQPFTQVDGSHSRSFGGTGLGLSIASRLVELMGGEIGFSSKKGKGSTFWFTVPLARSTEDQSDNAPLRVKKNTRLNGIKALVVDPHQISQTVILNHLLEWKLKATAVESNDEALAFLKHEADTGLPCDLVLISSHNLDISMDLARSISQDQNISSTNLVLLTRTREKKRLEEAAKAGFVTYLNRPVSGPKLQHALINLFNADLNETDNEGQSNQPNQSRSDTSQSAEGGMSILVAEDNAIVQKMVQMQLNRLGFAVRIVPNGQEAVLAAADNCALILMDCKMPVMDGFQAAQAIRAKETNGTHIPIIAMTAGTQPGEEDLIKNAGMDDAINKPIQIESLAEILAKWMPKPPLEEWKNNRSPDASPIELGRMGDYFGDDKKIIREILEVYQFTTESLLNKIKKHVNAKNRTALSETIQELRNSSANVGAVFLSRLCDHLESAKEENEWETNSQIVAEMDQELLQISSFTRMLSPPSKKI
ncbi:MAG: response regulator [Magnetococcales bacterium]|nr:response regulator [Magnetococcales bacterium]